MHMYNFLSYYKTPCLPMSLLYFSENIVFVTLYAKVYRDFLLFGKFIVVYYVFAGQVMVDGHGIKGLKLKWLRQQIGLVSQEPTFFAITIQENILLG
ncbi:putative Type I protein exporter [Helianthus anomalus]